MRALRRYGHAFHATTCQVGFQRRIRASTAPQMAAHTAASPGGAPNPHSLRITKPKLKALICTRYRFSLFSRPHQCVDLIPPDFSTCANDLSTVSPLFRNSFFPYSLRTRLRFLCSARRARSLLSVHRRRPCVRGSDTHVFSSASAHPAITASEWPSGDPILWASRHESPTGCWAVALCLRRRREASRRGEPALSGSRVLAEP